MKRKTVSKNFDLKVASDYIYSINFGTSLTEEVEYETEEDFKKESDRIASQVRTMTREDASKMLQGLRIAAEQSVDAMDSKKAVAVQSLKCLITRMEAIGIK